MEREISEDVEVIWELEQNLLAEQADLGTRTLCQVLLKGRDSGGNRPDFARRVADALEIALPFGMVLDEELNEIEKLRKERKLGASNAG